MSAQFIPPKPKSNVVQLRPRRTGTPWADRMRRPRAESPLLDLAEAVLVGALIFVACLALYLWRVGGGR